MSKQFLLETVKDTSIPHADADTISNSYWHIMTSSIHEHVASNCDATMTECSHMLSMDAFLSQWCWNHAVI